MSELERLLIGRVLVGRYGIEEVIGRGGMSVVYRATDHRLSRPIALKAVSYPAGLEAAEHSELRERLGREASSAARIPPHPNVVQIYDYGTDPELDIDFIAMELLRGRDLKRALRDGGLSAAEVKRVLVEAARGLAAGHRAGIIHRDVKPANIFLVGDQNLELVKILDFGIAKAFDGLEDDEVTKHGRIPHSPAYTSPEQLDPARPLTPASDVYQLGLVAYEVLAGERPYSEEERSRIRGGERIPLPVRGRWSEVDDVSRRAIERALEFDPQHRFPEASAFAAALGATHAFDDATLFISADVSSEVIAEDGAPARTVGGVDGVGKRPTSDVSAANSTPSRATDRHTRAVPLPRRSLASPITLAVALAVIAVIFWGRWLPDGEMATPLAENLPDIESLHEEFRPLLLEAFTKLRESRSADEGEEAAAAVGAVIRDLYSTWVEGQLDAHLDNYDDRVDFRGNRNTDRSRIGRIREETVERFPEREITITNVAIEFVAPGRARALVDRRWSFAGSGSWEGAARDELVLARLGDEWKVVAESELESVDERRPDG